MEQSKQFALNSRDFLNGLIVAVAGAGAAALESALTTTPVVFNWQQIGYTALAAGVGYIVKNFFSKPSTTTVPSK